MAYVGAPLGLKLRAPVGGFSEDAQQAIANSPAYFAAWYTAKSIGLAAALAWVAYLIGKERGRRAR